MSAIVKLHERLKYDKINKCMVCYNPNNNTWIKVPVTITNPKA